MKRGPANKKEIIRRCDGWRKTIDDLSRDIAVIQRLAWKMNKDEILDYDFGYDLSDTSDKLHEAMAHVRIIKNAMAEE